MLLVLWYEHQRLIDFEVGSSQQEECDLLRSCFLSKTYSFQHHSELHFSIFKQSCITNHPGHHSQHCCHPQANILIKITLDIGKMSHSHTQTTLSQTCSCPSIFMKLSSNSSSSTSSDKCPSSPDLSKTASQHNNPYNTSPQAPTTLFPETHTHYNSNNILI